jgi:hypothetical protein
MVWGIGEKSEMKKKILTIRNQILKKKGEKKKRRETAKQKQSGKRRKHDQV